MKPVKNISPVTKYKGICSGNIYTLLYYYPCHETNRPDSCKLKSCYLTCVAYCEYSYKGERNITSFNAEGIEKWRI